MLKRAMFMAVALLCLGLMRASAGELAMGDPAPKITVAKFVKGEPVTQFEKGKLYVVEFWATWCGPCKVSIPHLTELQKKYKDVNFIGVSVWERGDNIPEMVSSFVSDMGSKMDYRVALDIVPEGKDGSFGMMAVNWMEAAKQDGIPTAFIVNKESQVAWIGHPMVMEEPLKKIVAGKWNIKVEANKAKMERAAALKAREVSQKLQKALQAQDTNEALSVLDEAIAADPEMEKTFGPTKLAVLRLGDKNKEAAEYGGKLVDGLFKKDPMVLNEIAWSIVNPDSPKKPTPELLTLALKTAQRADKLKEGKDPAIADTLAKAYFDHGDIDKAIETQTRAVNLAMGTQYEKDPSLKERLEQYQKAKKK
jgi:thiol-disulfide isomerase/thioredoxin